MYYCYEMDSIPDKDRCSHNPYYESIDEFRDIKLKEFNTLEELDNFLANEPKDECWWVVHESTGPSTRPVYCNSREEALQHILESNNLAMYETIHDL